MNSSTGRSTVLYVITALLLIAAVWGFFEYRATWPRGAALGVALQPMLDSGVPDQSQVARAILDNYPNRLAAADFESMGYRLLENPAANPRSNFAEIAIILHARHVAITGSGGPTSARAAEAVTDTDGKAVRDARQPRSNP
ncbi:MAG: hypothetical protein WDO56_05975 [Gammaproteobacteria bacterium]